MLTVFEVPPSPDRIFSWDGQALLSCEGSNLKTCKASTNDVLVPQIERVLSVHMFGIRARGATLWKNAADSFSRSLYRRVDFLVVYYVTFFMYRRPILWT